MDSGAIRAFVQRDWDAIAASKREHWAGRFRAEGWGPAWDAADTLLLDMRVTNPGYPSPDDRARDLSDHSLLRDRLNRIADALAGR